MIIPITDFTEATSVAQDDWFNIIDVSDTTMATTGTNKKIKTSNIFNYFFIKSTGDTTDRRAEIQAALDAAETAGGGIVELGIGSFRIITVNSPASGSKAGGAYGLEIPSNVTLKGQGNNTIISIHTGGAFGTGVGISPKGMRTATVDYGASSNVSLLNFKVEATSQEASSGNLINLVHASFWLIENVWIGSSYYHGVEIDQSKNIQFINCRFDGEHSYGSSGNHVQFDFGDAGPTNRPGTITTVTVENVTFQNCLFAQRTNGAVREIELMHANFILKNIKFLNCEFHGKNAAFTNIVDCQSLAIVAGYGMSEILFEGCSFYTYHYLSYAFYLIQNSGGVFDGIVFRNNTFYIKGHLMWTGGASGSSSNLTTVGYRKNFEFTGNKVYFDKSQFPASAADYYMIVVNHWDRAVISNNIIQDTSDFPAGYVANNYYIIRTGQCHSIICTNNKIKWSYNVPAYGNKYGIAVWNDASDNAGYTKLSIVENNYCESTSQIWTAGIYSARGSTIPSGCVSSFIGNWANVTTTAHLNVFNGGTNTAGFLGLSLPVKTVTTNTTLTEQDCIVNCNTASGSITITPSNVVYRKTYFLVKTSASNTLTCGSSSVTANGSTIMLYSDGTTNFTTVMSPT